MCDVAPFLSTLCMTSITFVDLRYPSQPSLYIILFRHLHFTHYYHVDLRMAHPHHSRLNRIYPVLFYDHRSTWTGN